MNRRKFIEMSVVAGGSAAATAQGAESDNSFLLNYLCPPDNSPPDLTMPSPPTPAFKTKFFIPPLMKPHFEIGPPDQGEGWTNFDYQPFPDKPEIIVKSAYRGMALDPSADPEAHQLFDTFPPLKFYQTHEKQVLWKYGDHDGYEMRSASWGYQAEIVPRARNRPKSTGFAPGSQMPELFPSRSDRSIVAGGFNPRKQRKLPASRSDGSMGQASEIFRSQD